MQQVEQTRNIFGFPVANEDDRLFEKTANFFCPCPTDKKEETSFSTVVTDETKENSAPVTPEKSKRVKICKVSTKTPAAFAKNIGAFSNLNNFGDTFGKNNKLPLIIKSNDSTTIKQIQDIRTILPRVFFSQRSQRPSTSVNESASEVKYQAKDLIFTTDVSFETENFLNLNKTFNENETIPNQTDTLDQKITTKNFVIKKSNKNKIQISKFNKIGTFNPLSNSHNLAPSTTQKLPETEINHLQQKIVEKLKPRYLTIEADTSSDMSKRTIQSIISQIPQTFTFEEHVQKKLGTLNHLPKTTTNADLMKNFKPVITPKRDLNSIKLRAKSPNMMTSLDLNSLVSPKAANTRIQRYPASEVLDTQPNTLSKRPSSRFRPQEDLLEKLFNPANQKKKN